MTNTETNVAAQAGDEPMAYMVGSESHVTGIYRTMYDANVALSWSPDYKLTPLYGSPRATADVEREKRQAERVERLVRAAKVYTYNYLQDEHEEAELCICGPKQQAELVELFAALAAIATTKPGA